MHELPVMKSIFDMCVKHAKANNASKIISVTLKVGEFNDLKDEWMQRYFDYLSKGTFVEGAKLIIERVPLVMRCKKCSESFQVDIRERRQIECPRCKGTEFAYVSGKEYRVESMEVVCGGDTADRS
jgi:hydrogenase nickel incorporation protein HypA/HybF